VVQDFTHLREGPLALLNVKLVRQDITVLRMIMLPNAALVDTTVLRELRSHTLVGGAPIMRTEAKPTEKPAMIAHQVPIAPVVALLIIVTIFAQKAIIVQRMKQVPRRLALQVTTSVFVEVRLLANVYDAQRATSAKAHVFNQRLARTVLIAQAALLQRDHVNLDIIAPPWPLDSM
jgi:hypothetical protein